MNLPNKITLLRILMVPVFMVCLMVTFPGSRWLALILFVAAAATDGVDGYLARKNNQVTTFGKFVDPLADKLLVSAALIGLVELGSVPAWAALVIIAREFIVTSLRIVAISANKVIAATMTGKIKTTLQIIAIAVALFDPIFEISFGGIRLSAICIYIATLYTIYSGYDYLKKNWDLINNM